MPTYEYECTKCGKQFEYFQSIKDAPMTTCEECGGELTKLLSGGTGLIFKGSGFYITDYKNNSNKSDFKPSESSESKPAGSKPAESKPAATPAPKDSGK